MWATVSGEDHKYKLNFIPVYLTTEPKTTLMVQEAVSNNVAAVNPYEGYAGDFTVAGSYCEFVLEAPLSGSFHATKITVWAFIWNLFRMRCITPPMMFMFNVIIFDIFNDMLLKIFLMQK